MPKTNLVMPSLKSTLQNTLQTALLASSLTFSATLPIGCSSGGDASTQYLNQLGPLLQENGLLAERVLILAAQVYNESAKPEQVADSWGRVVVPISEHLADQASFVQPPQPFAETHAELVQIWSDRAVAYRNLSEAIHLGDTDGWNAARESADDVKLREEKWFDTLNSRVASSGLIVDPYP